MLIFSLFTAVIIIQRLAEVWIAKGNEQWMKARGAVEYGEEHYPFMVSIHTAFFISLIVEGILRGGELSRFWPIYFTIFILAQAARTWVILSLGRFWNTKIIVLPGARIVSKGPFRFVRHPNYIIVTAELLVVPLMFQAYWTAAVFFILNQIILSIRIPAEEMALKKATNYSEKFGGPGKAR